MLTQEQINHFQTFGFLTFRQLFSQDELKTIHTEFEAAMTEAFRDDPFDGTRRHWLITMGPDTPFLASLLEDPRFCDTAEQLYGEDVFGIASDINRYVGDTRWHPDTGSLHQYGVKFAYYLQPVDAESGALRLIPDRTSRPSTGSCGKRWRGWNLIFLMCPPIFLSRNRGMWWLSMCDAGMRVGVVRWIAGCVFWCTTTIQKRRRKRKPLRSRLSAMGLTMGLGLPMRRGIPSVNGG